MTPLKCAFGIYSRKLLGFIIYRKGIDLDLTKAMPIQAIEPPMTCKQLFMVESILCA